MRHVRGVQATQLEDEKLFAAEELSRRNVRIIGIEHG
jgi:hypothetical protein